MTQEPIRVQLRAADIAQAIMQSVVENETTYTYLAATLKQMGGSMKVDKSVLEGLRDGERWEVIANPVGDDAVEFRLLEGSAKINAALGRTPGGLVVP